MIKYHVIFFLICLTAFGWKRVAMRSAVVFLGVAVGESVPRFDIVMSLIGGTLTGPLVFVLPPLMYSRARELRVSVLGLRRASAPEFLCCGPERRAGDTDVFSDPRVHSRYINELYFSFDFKSECFCYFPLLHYYKNKVNNTIIIIIQKFS